MIITQTPVRISFLGGGTDYPEYFCQHGGATLAAAINKHTLITVHKTMQFADYKLRVYYSKIESVSRLDEIQHPSARECLRFLGIEEGVEIHYVTALPARTGLGSSSSATVGLLHALHAFKGQKTSNWQLAQEAVQVEQDWIKERVGCQDQYACALGGLLHLQFRPDSSVQANTVSLSAERLRALQERLILLYTSIQRSAHDVLEEQIERTKSQQITGELKALHELVNQGLEVLLGNDDLTAFGRLLHESWLLKRRLSTRISTPWIDEVYERARKAGAVGGKLLGAGSGGFLLLYVEPDRQAAVRAALPELPTVDFAFESSGSRIIHY